MRIHIDTMLERSRDRMTRVFLPENSDIIRFAERDRMDALARIILDRGEIKKMRSAGNEPDGDLWVTRTYVDLKKNERDTVNFRYRKIFDLCRVIGAPNVIDIGCGQVNQAFLLADYTNMTYLGIDIDQFVLIDYRERDYEDENIYFPYTEEAPSPFCDGRIKFLNAVYPFPIDAPANNIAVCSYSLANDSNPEYIRAVAEAFARDFDRVLFNTLHEDVEIWKNSACKCFDFYPIGTNRFVFGTKIPEDIVRMKEFYPFKDGRFLTGIDNYWEYELVEDDYKEGRFGYIHW